MRFLPAVVAVTIVTVMLLLSGALGLKTVGQCDNDPTVSTAGATIDCYLAAAITAAYVDSSGNSAAGICNKIRADFVNPGSPDDTGKKADMVANQCYSSVAKITKRADLCDEPYITQKYGAETQLTGSVVVQEMCKDEVAKITKLSDNYYNNTNNLCSIIFIFPALVVGALVKQGARIFPD